MFIAGARKVGEGRGSPKGGNGTRLLEEAEALEAPIEERLDFPNVNPMPSLPFTPFLRFWSLTRMETTDVVLHP